MKNEASVNLTNIMERDDITQIDRFAYLDGTKSFRVEISGRHIGYGPTVGDAYLKARFWADRKAA